MSSLGINIYSFHLQSTTIVTKYSCVHIYTVRDTTEEMNMSERQYRVFISASISSRYEVWCQASKMVKSTEYRSDQLILARKQKL